MLKFTCIVDHSKLLRLVWTVFLCFSCPDEKNLMKFRYLGVLENYAGICTLEAFRIEIHECLQTLATLK